jgi:hypothetical protein
VVVSRDLRHLGRQRQVVRGVFEEHVRGHVDLVEADVLLEVAEAEGQR